MAKQRNGRARAPRKVHRAVRSISKEAQGAKNYWEHNDDLCARRAGSKISVYGLSRVISNTAEILTLLDLKSGSTLNDAGFFNDRLNDQDGPAYIPIINGATVRPLVMQFHGSEAEFNRTILGARGLLPEKRIGKIGGVGILGALEKPGYKYIAWHLEPDLKTAIQKDYTMVSGLFDANDIRTNPRLIFAKTLDGQQALEWLQELTVSAPSQMIVELGAPQPSLLTITL